MISFLRRHSQDDVQCLHLWVALAVQIVPSGGLVGFRVAEDLLVKDYNNYGEQKVLNPWDGKNRDD